MKPHAATRAGVLPRLATCSFAVANVISCAPDPAALLPELTAGPGIEVTPVQRSPHDLELHNATTLALVGEGLLVVDAGNHRLVRVDSLLYRQSSFGAPGRGPGEIGHVVAVEARGDTVALGDIGSGRIVFFDVRHGAEIRRATAGTPRSIAWLHDGSVAAPGNIPGHYLVRATFDGLTSGFARIPPELAHVSSGDDHLVAGCGAGLHVLDDAHGVLLYYDIDGELRSSFRLPEHVRRELIDSRSSRIKVLRQQGYRVIGMPLVKQLAPLGCDTLVILFSHPGMFGLFVDLVQGTARPLLYPDQDDSSAVLRRANAVAPAQHGLVVLSQDELVTYAFR